MTVNYKDKKYFTQEELEWAISLIEKEHDRKERNTPEKMAKLIASEFDVNCSASQIYRFFGLEEDYELETKKIEHYDVY